MIPTGCVLTDDFIDEAIIRFARATHAEFARYIEREVLQHSLATVKRAVGDRSPAPLIASFNPERGPSMFVQIYWEMLDRSSPKGIETLIDEYANIVKVGLRAQIDPRLRHLVERPT